MPALPGDPPRPCPLRLSIGALLLGALAPAERHRVLDHLDGCPSCRDELIALAPLPALLRRARPTGRPDPPR
jgi:anti-sigma factor RsiW